MSFMHQDQLLAKADSPTIPEGVYDEDYFLKDFVVVQVYISFEHISITHLNQVEKILFRLPLGPLVNQSYMFTSVLLLYMN